MRKESTEDIGEARRAFLRLAEPYLDLLDKAREKLGFGVKSLCRDQLELLWELEAELSESDPYGWLEFVDLREAPSSPGERIPTAFRLPREKVARVRVYLEVQPPVEEGKPPVVQFWLPYYEKKSGYELAEVQVRLTYHSEYPFYRVLEATVDSDDFQGEGYLPRALWEPFLEEKWGNV